MNSFQSLHDYEVYVYGLSETFPRILYSTLVVVQHGRGIAELTGEIVFPENHHLVVYELLHSDLGQVSLELYGYEFWRGSEKPYWYDSQPHPHEPSPASTHPHHKHVPPDIKHNRIPAPGLSFDTPNLPFLIQEIEAFLP